MQALIEFAAALTASIWVWRQAAGWYRRRGHGKWLSHAGGAGAFILSFVILAAIIATFDPPPGSQVPESTVSSSAAPPVPAGSQDERIVKVTSAKLFADYQANEVAADNVYKGKQLEVTGTVNSIDKDFLDDIVLQIKTSNPFLPIGARIHESMAGKAAALRKGQKLTLICEGHGAVMTAPQLGDCVF